ncbi:MAG TPA: AAA domain-containing protein, partial [Archangium sp.]|nr:AAA domain-containing protein [Archangium sp.]
ARQELTAAEARLSEHDAVKPGFLQRLFQGPEQRAWRSERLKRLQVRNQAAEVFERLSAELARCEQRLLDAPVECARSERKLSESRDRYASARREVAAARERLASRFVDPGFFERDHAEQHMATPWLDAADQRIRDDVFVTAMALHKAFIDAAAKPLRHNLGALMNGFSRSLARDERATLVDLWASFFLVVPLVSTTFASTERMLGALPPEALGWLFVDEAGQALPQAAVGALMRTRRAVVVGDPMQIEPVVVLPEVLTTTICRHFGVDPDRFNAPSASVQTLADAATPYVAEFEGKSGCRTVGVPLLVHRRCAEPMFGISNAIAYQRLMVNAKVRGPSRIREVLGPSAWLDVQGDVDGKWCPEEGALTVELLRRLARAGVNPDLYIVTPFVMVAENLRRVVRESRVMEGWTNRSPWQWTTERIGTVHTVQGREAEAVVFVLGAPALDQEGARGWAGRRVNLLNVAVTRAKEQLYVIGNRSLWRGAGFFRELDARLPPS